MKRALRSWLDAAAARSGLTALLERRMRGSLTVLMYHRVLPDEECRDYPFPSLVMTATAFAAQTRLLAQRFDVQPLGTALERLTQDAAPARALLAITFDDGYRDNATIAAPLLEEAGLRGTFFVTTGFVEAGVPMWFDEAARLFAAGGERGTLDPLDPRASDFPAWIAALKSLSASERARVIAARRAAADQVTTAGIEPMSPADVRALHERGHEIGSHTRAHEILPGCDDAALAAELTRSRDDLRRWTGAPVRGFCYPNGNHDPRVRAATRAAGYAYACTTASGTHRRGDDPFAIRRLDVTRRRVLDAAERHDAHAFRAEVARIHDFMRRASGRGA